jgi:hypothetical protein
MTKEQKKERNKGIFEKIRNEEVIKRKERRKKEGTYRTGMNMEDPADEEDGVDADGKQPARKKRKTAKDAVCPHCGRKGHTTSHSKQCLNYNGRPRQQDIPEAAAAAAIIQEETVAGNDNAEDLDAYEALRILAEGDDDADSDDEFCDCNTCSDDDEVRLLNVI